MFSPWTSVLEKENVKYFGCTHTYNHPYIVLCILQPCKHLRPHLNSKPKHKLLVSPDVKFHIRRNQSARPPPHVSFFFLPQWPRRTSDLVSGESAPRRGRSTAVLPLRSTGRAASSARIISSFTCIQDFSSWSAATVPHLCGKLTPIFWYIQFIIPPFLCSIPIDSRLTHIASGPIGVRLWGALKPPRLIPFHHRTREALKPQGQLLRFFGGGGANADGPSANQSLVYILWLTILWHRASQSQPPKQGGGLICKHLE